MFGHNRNELPYDYSSEFPCQFPLPDSHTTPTTTTLQTFPSPPLFLPPLAIPGEHDSISALRSELGYTSSGCSSYVGSPNSITSYGTYSPTIIQRSVSSHSLQKNVEVYSPMNSSPQGFFSLQPLIQQGANLAQHNQLSNSPLATESSIFESMNRASPYSPEEKKERIERYRSKRNLRNFNKKIKYECRKTLADSRPRIRGRFAKNDEIEKTPQSQWDHTGMVESCSPEEISKLPCLCLNVVKTEMKNMLAFMCV
ncbi:hypothetical protein Pfo_007148 [Paulownia fortunei]|nr:hypothetical protein Pfo_007148 [Paulownia fortunei]